MSNIEVVKADGSRQPFKVEKLRRSLRRSGATREEVREVVAYIEARIYSGISTQEIYRAAFDKLKTQEFPAAARYSLRRALFNLGPTGFPFEVFLGKLFAAEGYTSKNNLIIPGRCVEHEIDLAAYKDDHSFVAEAKFHSRAGVKSDLQVALYCYARFLDLKKQRVCAEDICGIDEFRLITNTKFTKTAEKYAQCVGLPLLSWDYPRRDNLHDKIQRHGIYPITILQNLNNRETAILFESGVITCKDLLANLSILKTLHLSTAKRARITEEVNSLHLSKTN